jgi:integrase
VTGKRSFGSVRLMGSGRYQASYWHGGCRHVAEVTFRTKGDAQTFLDTVSADMHRGLWTDPTDGEITVSELSDLWLASNPSKRATTRATDEIALRVHILPFLGDKQIAKVKPPHIHALISGWAANAAPRTVRRQYATLRAMFAFAVQCEWISRTPCRAVKLPPVTSTRRHTLAPDDVTAIAEATDAQYRPMVWIGAVLGLRWSEVAGLRVGRVDFLQRTLTVAEALTRDGKGRPVLSSPKSTAGSRTLAIPPVLADILAEHMVKCGLALADRDRFLFESQNETLLRYSNWRRSVWAPAAAAAGHPDAGFHDLRRASATGLVSRGVDIKTVQARLGHSDPRLTLQVYAEVVQEADKNAADVMGEYFLLGIRERPHAVG